MKNMTMATLILVPAWFALCQALADDESPSDRTITWAVSHPEVARIFGHPFTAAGREHRRNTFIPWPAEVFQTDHVSSQPTIVAAPDGKLLAHGYDGWVLVSEDGGRTWQRQGRAPLVRTAPPGAKHLSTSLDGCGVTEKGTILVQSAVQYNDGRKYEGLSDPTYHVDLYVFRSSDGGKTWDPPIQLNGGPIENAGGHRTRFFGLPGGRTGLAMGAWFQSDTGEPLPPARRREGAYIWISEDDGRTWKRNVEPMCVHGAEPDILVLPSGRFLAALRYQRPKFAADPPDLVSPHQMRGDKPPFSRSKAIASGFVARVTVVSHSDDQGKTWSPPRMVTGFDEQTGCLVRLPDDAVILVFGHKTDGTGQRFMLSYDEGETWSRNVYALNANGLYASSVVLDDGTIVTVAHKVIKGVARFYAMRWRPPTFDQVATGGFWRPRVVEPLGVPAPDGNGGSAG